MEPTNGETSQPSADAEDYVEFLSRTFEACKNDHPQCSLAQTAGWIPTRLLDVQFANQQPDRIFLVESKDILANVADATRPYLTLSHVWGSSTPLSLTTGNYAHLRDGIALLGLPQCYKDAIYMARKLNVRYLWIDSLW